MAAPPAAERQPARNAHHRQVGRHAGMFEDAFAEHVLKVGGVGHQKGAVKNGPVLLGLAVDQVAHAVEWVDGAWVLQQ